MPLRANGRRKRCHNDFGMKPWMLRRRRSRFQFLSCRKKLDGIWPGTVVPDSCPKPMRIWVWIGSLLVPPDYSIYGFELWSQQINSGWGIQYARYNDVRHEAANRNSEHTNNQSGRVELRFWSIPTMRLLLNLHQYRFWSGKATELYLYFYRFQSNLGKLYLYYQAWKFSNVFPCSCISALLRLSFKFRYCALTRTGNLLVDLWYPAFDPYKNPRICSWAAQPHPRTPESHVLQEEHDPIYRSRGWCSCFFDVVDGNSTWRKISRRMGLFDFMERAAVAPRQFSSNITQNSFNDFDFPPPVSITRSVVHHASYFCESRTLIS